MPGLSGAGPRTRFAGQKLHDWWEDERPYDEAIGPPDPHARSGPIWVTPIRSRAPRRATAAADPDAYKLPRPPKPGQTVAAQCRCDRIVHVPIEDVRAGTVYCGSCHPDVIAERARRQDALWERLQKEHATRAPWRRVHTRTGVYQVPDVAAVAEPPERESLARTGTPAEVALERAQVEAMRWRMEAEAATERAKELERMIERRKLGLVPVWQLED